MYDKLLMGPETAAIGLTIAAFIIIKMWWDQRGK